ncbi:MAG: hypothetical protein ACXV6M_01035 [Ilumatobacteraceae bacterium]
MTSLQEFVATQFPNHEIDLLDPASIADLELSDHTVVSQVAGARDGLDLLNLFRRRAPYARVAAVAVRPSRGSLVPADDEDRNGVVDLPVRRVALAVLGSAVTIGLVLAVVMLVTHESVATAAVVGGFGVMIGAAIGAIIGGSRLAGQRATLQPRAPGRTITVVAAFLEDDASASSFAHSVGPMTNYDVRIVDQRGGWRSPGPVQ